jgi:5'(3')-deoxyribonucleotidase
MKRLTILCDLDSMVVNLQGPWYERWFDLTGERITSEMATDWDTTRFTKYGARVYSVLAEPGFFRRLPALPGGLEAVQALCAAGHNVVLASAAPPEAFGAYGDKAQWVHEQMPWFNLKNLMIGYPKEMLKGDVLLDDGPHNIEAYRKAWPQAHIATIAWPYNVAARRFCNFVAHDYRDTRTAWAEILAYVTSLARRQGAGARAAGGASEGAWASV